MKWYLAILLVCKLLFVAESNLIPGLGQTASKVGQGALDMTKHTVHVTEGVAEKIPDLIPSPRDLFQLNKNVLLGYPLDAVMSAVNEFCSAALSSKSIRPHSVPNMSDINYVLQVQDQKYLIPMDQPNQLWIHPQFNRNLPLVMMVTGWTTNLNRSIQLDPSNDVIYDAYRCRGGVNYVNVDTAAYLETLYSWSSLNTEFIGQVIGESLAELIHTYPTKQIHLIGHSLGAHIVGSAGRTFYEKTNQTISRITGLDPANPCFNEGETLSGLSRGDADFVDVIHSNPGVLGQRDPLGDVDFYPNGVRPLPPGCVDVVNSHLMAPKFYAESVYPGYENNFMAVRCNSLYALESKMCTTPPQPMGYATPSNLKGNYFLKTRILSPYGWDASPRAPTCHSGA